MAQRLVADVFDVIIVDSETGDVVAMDTLTDAGIDISTDTKEVRGGKGHKKIASLSAKRDINIKLSNPVWEYRTLAMQLGQTIRTGAGVGYASPKRYEVTAGKTITLDHVAKQNTLKMEKDGKPVTGTVSDKTVTFTTGVEAGDVVQVLTYEFDTPSTSESITIDSKKFAKACKLILKTLEINTDGSEAAELQIVFPSAQPTGNFSINTKSERDAVPTDIEFQVIEGGTAVQGEILRIPLGEEPAVFSERKAK